MYSLQAGQSRHTTPTATALAAAADLNMESLKSLGKSEGKHSVVFRQNVIYLIDFFRWRARVPQPYGRLLLRVRMIDWKTQDFQESGELHRITVTNVVFVLKKAAYSLDVRLNDARNMLILIVLLKLKG